MRAINNYHPVVVVESRFKSSDEFPEHSNSMFAQEICRNYALLGFNPIASHVYYTQFLFDGVINERTLGMKLGLEMAHRLRPVLVTFHLREGEDLSLGMEMAIEFWQGHNYPIHVIRWKLTNQGYKIMGVEES